MWSYKNGFLRITFLFLLFGLIFYSCKKDKIDIQFSVIQTNTTAHLYKIKQANEHTFYLCGGDVGSGIILKSIDTGLTWSVVQNNFLGKIFDFDFIQPQKMVAVSEQITFYLTDNDWQTWQYITPPAGEYPLTGYDSELFSVSMVNDTLGFSCGGKEYQHGVIYRTTDGGITWRYTYKEHEMKSVIMQNTSNGYAAGYGVIYKTADGGLNWNVTDASDDYFTAMAGSSGNHVFAAGYQGSIIDAYDYTDKWNKKNNSNKAFEKRIHFNCIDFFDDNNGAAAGPNGVIYITNDGGHTWQAGSAFDGTQINSIVLTAKNKGLAAGEKGKLYNFQF